MQMVEFEMGKTTVLNANTSKHENANTITFPNKLANDCCRFHSDNL